MAISKNYIVIGGMKRCIRINHNAASIWCDLQNASMPTFRSLLDPKRIANEDYKPSEIIHLFYAALVEGHRIDTGVRASFSIEDVGTWLDDLDSLNIKPLVDELAGYFLEPEALEIYKKAEELAKKKKPKPKPKRKRRNESSKTSSSTAESNPNEPES